MAERLEEVTILDHTVTPGMEVTLPKTPGRRKGRYRFDWAETDRDGNVILNVFGPIRARNAIPHYRLVNASVVQEVHAPGS